MHVIDDDSLCRCSTGYETPFHYFFLCPLYTLLREELMATVERITAKPTLNVLLYGITNILPTDNVLILEAVHSYIVNTKRF
jgi:hypothetical protein